MKTPLSEGLRGQDGAVEIDCHLLHDQVMSARQAQGVAHDVREPAAAGYRHPHHLYPGDGVLRKDGGELLDVGFGAVQFGAGA